MILMLPFQLNNFPFRCIHFYSALCAFASDPKLSEEFRTYIRLDRDIADRAAQQGRLQHNQVIAILGQDENGDTVQVEVLNQSELRGVQGSMETVLEQAVLHTVTEDIQIEMETPDGSVQTITVPANSIPDTLRHNSAAETSSSSLSSNR